MIDIESIFKYKVLDSDKLLAYGFVYSDGIFTKKIPIMENQFNVHICAASTGKVSFKVYETETGEEYVLVHVPNVSGAFVGEVRAACEKELEAISERCFNTQILKEEQTQKVIKYIMETYGASPEFLWKKYPDYAAFRTKENGKWFAVIMTVEQSKIGLSGHGNIEIIDLKDIPENIKQRLNEKYFFEGYHMNKKHWYTLCLDGSIPNEELTSMIDRSYELAANKKRRDL